MSIRIGLLGSRTGPDDVRSYLRAVQRFFPSHEIYSYFGTPQRLHSKIHLISHEYWVDESMTLGDFCFVDQYDGLFDIPTDCDALFHIGRRVPILFNRSRNFVFPLGTTVGTYGSCIQALLAELREGGVPGAGPDEALG